MIKSKVTKLVAISMSLFHLYTAAIHPLVPMLQRAVHLGFGLTLIYLTYPTLKKHRRYFYDYILVCLVVFTAIYTIWNYPQITPFRTAFPIKMDLIMGTLTIFLVLEGARRTIGNTLPIIAIIMLLYGFIGPFIPYPLNHPGITFQRMISINYLIEGEGIFGIPLGASATFVSIFIIFGAFLLAYGAGDFFIKLAKAALGGVRGGPAKMAVIASAVFGTISGSGVANVGATGQFTIPLMKSIGYSPVFAGAVESVASVGGQLMPPVMGAAAFIMVEYLGVAYVTIIKAAAIPALLYFFGVFFIVDLRAIKKGLKAIKKSERSSLRATLSEGWYYLIPPILLVFLIFMEFSPAKAAFYSIVSLLVLDLIVKRKLRVDVFLKALEDGARNMLVVVSTTALSGIIIQVLAMTGIGLFLTTILVELSGGNFLILMFLVMISSLILGMGLPTVACYIIVATLAAPALIEAGAEPIAAHLFVFYFGIIAAITPPVAIAAYVGAGIAGADPVRTGVEAFKLGIVAFLLPYMFVLNPSLLLMGPTLIVLRNIVTAVFGIIMLGFSIEGYLYLGLGKINLFFRAIFLIGAIFLLYPYFISDLIGLVIVLSPICYLKIKSAPPKNSKKM